VVIAMDPVIDSGPEEAGPTVALAWDEQDRRAMLELPVLEAGTVYTVTVLAAVDRAGNHLAAPVAFPWTPIDARLLFLPAIAK
jgi:hypothetical protein